MKAIDRIDLHAFVLNQIDRKRQETGDPNVGSGIEHAILNEALRDLEEDLIADPGALETMLVRLRPPAQA